MVKAQVFAGISPVSGLSAFVWMLIARMPHHSTSAALHGQVAASVVFQPASSTSTNTTGTSIGMSLLNQFVTLFMTFFNGLLNDVLSLIGQIFGGIGQSISEIFMNWGFTVSGQSGIFAPVVMVLILSLSGAVAYAFLTIFGAEKDVIQDEEEI